MIRNTKQKQKHAVPETSFKKLLCSNCRTLYCTSTWTSCRDAIRNDGGSLQCSMRRLNRLFFLNISGRVRFSWTICSLGMLDKCQLCCSTGVWPGGFNKGNMGRKGQAPMEKPDGNFWRPKTIYLNMLLLEESEKRRRCQCCCFSHREDPDGALVLFAADEFSSAPCEAQLLNSRGLHKHHVRLELRRAQTLNFLQQREMVLQSKKTAQYINMTASSSAVSQSKAEIHGHLLHLSTSADCISFN